MTEQARIVKGDRWVLGSVELPRGTRAQVMAWIGGDPRDLLVTVVKAPEEEPRGDVWFIVRSGETMRHDEDAFRVRYKPVTFDAPRPEQVPPEVPPRSHDEWLARKLEGW